jgi:hypothetical protein
MKNKEFVLYVCTACLKHVELSGYSRPKIDYFCIACNYYRVHRLSPESPIKTDERGWNE